MTPNKVIIFQRVARILFENDFGKSHVTRAAQRELLPPPFVSATEGGRWKHY